MTQKRGALGILQLQCKQHMVQGAIGCPDTYEFPIICRQVPQATIENVVFGAHDEKMAAAYISTAKELVREGAAAITTTCGFTIKYQQAMAQALSVPVATSSLLLLPYILRSVKGRVCVLTFDSRHLTADMVKCAGIEAVDRILIAGIENSETWRAMSRPENDFTVPQLAKDLLAVIALMRRQHSDIEAILFECAGFPLAAQMVREQTKLPVYDAVTNAKLLMSAAA
ncbi:hypothetical protein ACVIWU_006646 [Bradyrhizobium sp. USDA 4509]